MGGREEGREGGRNTEREWKTIVRQCILTQLQMTVIKRACELLKEYKEEKKRGKGKTHCFFKIRSPSSSFLRASFSWTLLLFSTAPAPSIAAAPAAAPAAAIVLAPVVIVWVLLDVMLHEGVGVAWVYPPLKIAQLVSFSSCLARRRGSCCTRRIP